MKSLFDTATRTALRSRLEQLHPESPARWGSFTAGRMLAHLIDALQVTFAERPAVVKPGFLNSAFGRWLMIEGPLPTPKNLPTAPEYLLTPAGDFERDRAHVLVYLDRFGQGAGQTWGPHPAFGTLSPLQVAILTYRHVHHHLTQFGV